jgi:hypothetical protein
MPDHLRKLQHKDKWFLLSKSPKNQKICNMKQLNLILAFFVAAAISGCTKSSLNSVKPTTSTNSLSTNSLIADSVTIYAGKFEINPVEVDGPKLTALFWGPYALAQDASGNLFVGDYYGNDIRKITTDGMVSTYSKGIDMPEYLAFDASGNLYMTYNQIVKVASNGSLSLISNSNYNGLTADNNGNIWGATQTQILKLNQSTGKMDLYAGVRAGGSADGDVSTASFTNIMSLAADKNGNLFVLDGNSIREINIAKGQVQTLTLKTQSPFSSPQAIAVDQWDNIYVTNYGDSSGNGYILKIGPDGTVSNFAGNKKTANSSSGLQGPAQSVSIDGPTGILLLPSGNFLVASTSGNVIQEITTHKQQ